MIVSIVAVPRVPAKEPNSSAIRYCFLLLLAP